MLMKVKVWELGIGLLVNWWVAELKVSSLINQLTNLLFPNRTSLIIFPFPVIH